MIWPLAMDNLFVRQLLVPSKFWDSADIFSFYKAEGQHLQNLQEHSEKTEGVYHYRSHRSGLVCQDKQNSVELTSVTRSTFLCKTDHCSQCTDITTTIKNKEM
jgi:hypothetical protein